MRATTAALSLLVTLLIGAASSQAEEFRITQQSRTRTPVTVFTAEDEFLAVWENRRVGIVGRFFSVVGEAVGPELVLAAHDALPDGRFEGLRVTRVEPALGLTGAGSFVLCWTAETADVVSDIFYYDEEVVDHDLFCRAFERDGSPGDGPFRINAASQGLQRSASLVGLADGGFLAVWQSTETGTDGGDGIFARRVDATGRPVGAELRVDDVAGSLGIQPAVAAAPDGSLMVVWAGCCDEADDLGIFARRLDATANPVTPPVQVNSRFTGNQREPSVAFDGLGNGLVAWYGPTDATNSEYRVYAGQVDAAGLPAGSERQVSRGEQWAHSHPALLGNKGGSFVLAWLAWEGYFQTGVFGAVLDASGAPLGEPFRISSRPIDTQFEISLTRAPDGGVLVLWAGQDDSYSLGISARLLRPAPELLRILPMASEKPAAKKPGSK